MSLPWCPRIDYGSTILSLSLPMPPWHPSSEMVGGGNISGAGVPEVFTVRVDELLEITLRFTETELAGVMAWLRSARGSGQAFTFRPDQDKPGAHLVYLHRPGPAEAIAPARDGDEPSIYRITVTLRLVTGAGAFVEEYFG